MFAGLPELFVILVVVFAAWHVVKAFNRVSTQPPRRSQARPQAQTQSRQIVEAEDLVSCRVCGTYIAVSARNCGRPNCPQPR
jgi:hypothetical protein